MQLQQVLHPLLQNPPLQAVRVRGRQGDGRWALPQRQVPPRRPPPQLLQAPPSWAPQPRTLCRGAAPGRALPARGTRPATGRTAPPAEASGSRTSHEAARIRQRWDCQLATQRDAIRHAPAASHGACRSAVCPQASPACWCGPPPRTRCSRRPAAGSTPGWLGPGSHQPAGPAARSHTCLFSGHHRQTHPSMAQRACLQGILPSRVRQPKQEPAGLGQPGLRWRPDSHGWPLALQSMPTCHSSRDQGDTRLTGSRPGSSKGSYAKNSHTNCGEQAIPQLCLTANRPANAA